MTCDEAIRAIEAMLDREIEDDERLQLEAHLAGCESCRRETEERRAFSGRIGRDLNDAFPPSANAAPRIVIRPRRFPWVRAAAVVLVGVAVGYVGSSSGFFNPASAEAREVASLSALKDAYENRNQELTARLEQDAGVLDRAVAKSPDGPYRDLGAICVMHAVSGLPEKEALVLPQDPEACARTVASQMSSPTMALRGRAVRAYRKLSAADVTHLERQIVNLKGANRTFTELYVLSLRAPPEPAIDFLVENGGQTLRVVQFQDARFRVEAPSDSATKVYEGCNLLDFQTRNPKVTQLLNLRGVDGKFTVGEMQLAAPMVESRPAVFVPAVVWSAPAAESAGFVEVLSVQAAMTECVRAGRTAEECERKVLEVRQRVQATPANEARVVRADPALVKRYLVEFRRADANRLALTREQLQDRLASLERLVLETERRIDCIRKAMVALECQEKPR